MKLTRFLFFIFVLRTSAVGDLTGFFEEYGNGICEEEKMEQLKKQEQNCTEHKDFFYTTLILLKNTCKAAISFSCFEGSLNIQRAWRTQL